MILGTLTLLQKSGIIYKNHSLETEDSFSEAIATALQPETPALLSTPPEQYRVIPIDASEDTDYIHALFEDEGKAQYPYTVTIWVLTEALPEPLLNTNDVILK